MNQFTITSGAMRVTDPCYDVEVWCSGELNNVMNGTWIASVLHYKDPDDFYDPVGFVKNGLNQEIAQYEAMKKGDAAYDALVDQWIENRKERYAERIKIAESYPGRVSVLRVRHESTAEDIFDRADKFVKSDIDVGVDSGQAGFFDLKRYEEYGGPLDDSDREEYHAICKLTHDETVLGHPGFGTNEWGAVSSSGYGDGGYSCHVLRDEAGQVIAAYILYIDPNDSSDDDEE